jgi:antitoxin component YwqK of YwqJK toxin-antitoxin module
MKNIICILALFFFISDCSADARILEQLKAKSNAKAKSVALKKKKSTKKVSHKSKVPRSTKPKETPIIEITTKEDLDIKNDLAYLPNRDKPFTGKHQQYHSNGKKYTEIYYKDGKRNGLIIVWDEYEHKVGQLSYMGGELLE